MERLLCIVWESAGKGMTINEISANENVTSNLVALDQWRDQIGKTAATIWRWRKLGWLQATNIAGRLYLTRAEIARFEAAAAAGKFARVHRTPAAKEEK
jgi:hypothetical protein